MTFVLAVLAYLPKVLLGFSVAHWLWSETRPAAVFLKLFISAPLGMGLASFLFFFWKLWGLGDSAYIVFELVVVAFVLLSMLSTRRDTFWHIRFSSPSLPSGMDKALLAAMLFAVGVSFAGFLLTVLMHPHGREDAWVNWNLIGRFIHGSPDLSNALDYIASSVFPGYPFMLGLTVANGWVFAGAVTTRVPIVVSALFTFALPGMIFFSLYELKGFRMAALAVILVCSAWLADAGSYLYSDIPVSFFYLAAGVLLVMFLHSRSFELLTLAGLTAGLAPWTKNDGLPFVVLVIVAVSLLAWLEKDRRIILRFLLGLALPLAVLGFYKIALASPGNVVNASNGPLDRLFDLARLRTVTRFFANTTFGVGSPFYGYAWALLAVALAVGMRFRERGVQLLAFIILLPYAAYFLVYMITPLDLEWHLGTSIGRILTHLMPLFTFFIFYSLRPTPLLQGTE